ncbi:Carbohydrate binding family 6 [Catenulispora acidiphila DSM 44928]|uniref:Alpha-galactosidase n=1 Tax=Catenulispora acidiphila (strain DSM 44928 / JCM 14897 / NBRC 102108 / NRRL B-24433 / ID139908) TaxID=479433 RepID=C7PXL9_CATAD|nr:CBM35 domain-containing protein [Catenulispora acidiphila]ACU71472.1 Carbohydrate binding family 6 [Catenulispora acidiphila DSM 44928]
MRSSSYFRTPKIAAAVVVLAVGSLASAALTAAGPANAAQAAPPPTTTANAATVAATPFMGWSSWSMQSSSYPGLNPNGNYSYLTEANVLKQTDALAAKLKAYGYDHVDIDAGWWRDNNWTPEYDQNARQTPDPVRFPHGMQSIADHIHSQGLKAGIYLPVGLEKEAYGGGTVPIANAPGCTTADIVYPDLRTTNGWDSSYKLNFANACAQKYVDSQAQMLAGWGYDFLKIDGVGPGSGKSGDNYDNTADVAAWNQAIAATGRPIHLELSWSLDRGNAANWKQYSNGWRVDTDVECYCNTLVTWDNSVKARWNDAPVWSDVAGPGGWNDLDSLDVGNGTMDGLTNAERQSYMTLWAIEKSPLFTGDDLTQLDSYGLSLLTNREVIGIDQNTSPVARPVSTMRDQQVWATKNADGSYTVALFNMAAAPESVSAYWAALGFQGNASVHDLWNHQNLGSFTNQITEALPAHGSRLFTITPAGSTKPVKTTSYEAESTNNTLTGGASLTACTACSGGSRVGNLYGSAKLQVNNVTVKKDGIYTITVSYVDGSTDRTATISSNTGSGTSIAFPSTGDWNTVHSISFQLGLKAGSNSITFDSAGWYSPDIDKIDVPVSS